MKSVIFIGNFSSVWKRDPYKLSSGIIAIGDSPSIFGIDLRDFALVVVM
jgi:hypothetical protein